GQHPDELPHHTGIVLHETQEDFVRDPDKLGIAQSRDGRSAHAALYMDKFEPRLRLLQKLGIEVRIEFRKVGKESGFHRASLRPRSG
ncbi:MAG: hypothetical protein ACSLE2_19300, partial [Lysobacterales bacterium]